MGRIFEQGVSTGLSHAAEVAQNEVGFFAAELAEEAHLADRLLLRHIPNAAGVEQDHVGIGFPFGQTISTFGEHGRNLLRVSLVHLATIGLDIKAGHESEQIAVLHKIGRADHAQTTYCAPRSYCRLAFKEGDHPGNARSVFVGGEFGDTALMASGFKWGLKPDIHDLQREGERDRALSDGDDVGVVVTAAEFRCFVAPTKRTTNTFDLVGGYGFAVSRTSEHDAAIDFLAGDGFCRWDHVKRVVGAIGTMGTIVGDLVSRLVQMRNNGFLV